MQKGGSSTDSISIAKLSVSPLRGSLSRVLFLGGALCTFRKRLIGEPFADWNRGAHVEHQSEPFADFGWVGSLGDAARWRFLGIEREACEGFVRVLSWVLHTELANICVLNSSLPE